MTYRRVIPRDLFNEANLLKCLGRLVLLIEDNEIDWMQYHHDSEPFHVVQDEASGSLSVTNLQFWTLDCGATKELYFDRPLNSRDPWPLYVQYGDECYTVFDDEGNFILQKVDFMGV